MEVLQICLIYLIILICDGKLVFPAYTDVGYILPDTNEEVTNAKITNTNQINEDIKASVKRALGNSISDGLGQRNALSNQKLSTMGREGYAEPLDDGFTMDEFPSKSLQEYVGKKHFVPTGMEDDAHGVIMGVVDGRCDDGKTNLTLDWDGSPVNHTCYTPKKRFRLRYELSPVMYCNPPPEDYSPQHFCMNENIHYGSLVPTFGDHRPLWPVYGEYEFVPVQRWLHSIEHGAIVMLYHPCAQPIEVNRLKELVKGCIYKHVITPHRVLSHERPLSLIAWGCRLEMSYVDEEIVKEFIKSKALKGPEGKLSKQGKFTVGLKEAAKIPMESDLEDSNLCP